MKKITLLMSFIACVIFAQAQTTIYSETCGTADVSLKPKVELYTGWDNPAPITYTRTTTLDGYADVRTFAGATNNVWFPGAKGTDLIISNIPAVGYKNLKLSFDVATYNPLGTDQNKVNVYCNGTLLTIPSAAMIGTNTFQTVANINIDYADVINLKFEYTALTNPSGIGYRLDNFKITADLSTEVSSTKADFLTVSRIGKNLAINNIANGSTVEIYSTVGTRVQSAQLINGSIQLNDFSKGLYIVRVGNQSSKIML